VSPAAHDGFELVIAEIVRDLVVNGALGTTDRFAKHGDVGVAPSPEIIAERIGAFGRGVDGRRSRTAKSAIARLRDGGAPTLPLKRPAVARLLRDRCPATVAGLVIAIDVDAIERLAGRCVASIGVVIFESQPTCTRGDAECAVIAVTLVVRTQ